MAETGADFTNTFRWLAMVQMPPASNADPQHDSHADVANGSAHLSLDDAGLKLLLRLWSLPMTISPSAQSWKKSMSDSCCWGPLAAFFRLHLRVL
jgi:hypothetical protein